MTDNQQSNNIEPQYLESRKVAVLGFTARYLAQIKTKSGEPVFLTLNEQPAFFSGIVAVWHKKSVQPLPSPLNR